ncbi:hypothetical protein [Sansalvadorimonas verongulae]|uniref:hypothetical protein n=1 Tax=Sansalvadorimonas verongulae TaxID=2172824 RepID=UPI0012BBE7E3|nr:hypothetical protein [Sansalvadorimonas verongulae]MTI12371.1 hypothetical protein [Sansalvadorimonas verongulae]
MYPTTGTALLYAFNDTLFDDTSLASWQQQVEDKYPEEAPYISFDAVEQAVGYEHGRLRKKDWHTQAGMVSALLMDQLEPAEYWLLHCFYNFDNEVAVISRAWMYLRPELVDCTGIRKSIRENNIALDYMSLRAIKPKLLQAQPTFDGAMNQRTITVRQSEVKRHLHNWKDDVYQKADTILRLNKLLWENS